MYNIYANKKNGSYEFITSAKDESTARKKAKNLSSNEYHSYMIVKKSQEEGDQVVERKELEDLDWRDI